MTITQTEEILKAKKEIYCQTLQTLSKYSGKKVLEIIEQIQDQQEEIADLEAYVAEARLDMNIFRIESLKSATKAEIKALVLAHAEANVSEEEKKTIGRLIEQKRKEYLEMVKETAELKSKESVDGDSSS